MIIVTRAAYMGAKLTRAKNDVRDYLNAVFFDPEGFIVATDGHRIFRDVAAMEGVPESGVIVDVTGKEPAKFVTANFDLDKLRVSFLDANGGIVAELPFNMVDGRFPDWRRVTNYNEGKISAIGLNMAYLTDAAKIAKCYNVTAAKIEFQDTVSAVRVNLSTEAFLMIMPARVK